MKRTLIALGLVLVAAGVAAQTAGPLPRSKAPEHVRLYIISPKDGATVGRDVTVRFGLEGMGVAPAGVDKAGTGHHHLLVDVKALPPADQPIPKDEHHLHFGNGQTETALHLAPGTQTLQLDLGDANHLQFDPPIVSPKITIHVK